MSHAQPTTSEGSLPIALGIDDAAKAIGLSRTTIYALAKEGRITIHKVHGRSLIRRSDLEGLLT